MDKTIDHGAQLTMYGGAGTAVTIWGLNLGEWAAVVSAGVAVLGFIVHCWAVLRKDRREERRLKLEELNGRKTEVNPQR